MAAAEHVIRFHPLLLKELTMRISTLATVLVTTSLLALGAQAQVLGTITASPLSAKVGEPVTVTATIDVLSSNYCGYVVGFGDGTVKDAVSDLSNATPLVLTHTYAKAGNYHVTLGGKNVQNHPNCGGQERAVDVVIADTATPAAAGKPQAASVCASGWKVVGKTFNAKTGAFTCGAKAGTKIPADRPVCRGDLSYFENIKKGQYGCKP
jgi:hypothetical protein